MRSWSWNMATGIRILAHALGIATVCVAIAEGAAAEDCERVAERYANAPHQTTLAALQACLEAERGSLQATASPGALPWPAPHAGEEALPVEPWARQPQRGWGDWPSAEPWAHTPESWPDKPW